MKRMVCLALVVMLLFTLAGCTQNQLGGLLKGSSESSDADIGGVGDGRLGDKIETAFFNFVVHSGFTTSSWCGYHPQDGKELLVVEVTVENTCNASIPMYDVDFQAQWGEDDDDTAYAFPITTNMETGEEVVEAWVNADQIPYEYELAIGGSRTGILVYEVPVGYKDFSISVLDDFDDGREGDVYFVYFTAEQKEAL